MSDMFLIGIDIGTQGTKGVLFTAAGVCLASAFCPSRLFKPSQGVVEEDPERQLDSVCQVIRQCLRKAKVDPAHVAALSIDGQMAGVIGMRQDGMNATPYDSWLDTRCAPYIKKMQASAGEEILLKTGCSPSFNHGPRILWWMNERKTIFREIKSFVMPGAYAAMRLCGLDASSAYIDKTYLHFTGFADNRNSTWDEALCRLFGLDSRKLPRIANSHDVVGEIVPSMARRCGLKAHTPVVAGCGDTAASFLSCGATMKGICVDVAGTASVFSATTDEFRSDTFHQTMACGQSATPGLWHPYAYINGGGMDVEWFREVLGGKVRQSKEQGIDFDHLNKLAANLPAHESIPLFIPHLGGRVCPPQPDLQGAFVGLNWSHKTAHLYKAILESVALEYKVYRNALDAMYPGFRPREIRVTGGGSQSALWNQIKADVLQIPTVQVTHTEGAPLGSAILAGFGVGIFNNLTQITKSWIKLGKSHKPSGNMAAHYRRRFDVYDHLLRQLDSLEL
ncbi:MAG: FGGY family carbohydrate kinase [bacterium]|nr:FGGY family carbohydrate kinase [Candidatus Sumerlaeota bacterium]